MKKTAVTCVLMIMLPISGCRQQKSDDYALISFLMGEVTVNGQPAEIGGILKQSDRIHTGDKSFCDISIGESIIRIQQNSDTVLESIFKDSMREDTILSVTTGKVLCRPKKLLKADRFVVKTPTAIAGVRGTDFSVELDKKMTTRVTVYSGEVKLAKRVRQFERSLDRVIDVSRPISKEQKAVITADDVKKAETEIDVLVKKEISEISDANLAGIIGESANTISVSDKKINRFTVEDFGREKIEIEEVRKKPAAVVRHIVKMIEQEKEKPQPEGRILVTKYDIYFIKDGRVAAEAKPLSEPVRSGERLYTAGDGKLYCFDEKGIVYWSKSVPGIRGLNADQTGIRVETDREEIRYEAETGEKL